MSENRYTEEFLAKLRDRWAGAEFQGLMARLESMRARGRGAAAWEGGEDADALRRLVQAATVMSFMLEKIHIEAGPRGRPPAEASGCALRLAGLWEGLSEVCHPEPAEWHAFDAACAYELAGAPEDARRMAKWRARAAPGTAGTGCGRPQPCSCNAGLPACGRTAGRSPASPTMKRSGTSGTAWRCQRLPARCRTLQAACCPARLQTWTR